MPRVAAIVLAAGASSRMGRPKQLLPVEGVPMLVRAMNAAREAGCDPIVVVLGRDADVCVPLVAKGDVRVELNPDWEKGMGSSLRTGALALTDAVDAAYVLLGDQPGVTAGTLGALEQSARETAAPVVVAAYADTVGPPVRVNAAYLNRLRQWPGADGAKRLWLERPTDVVRVSCPEAAFDVDTPADYDALRGRLAKDGG